MALLGAGALHAAQPAAAPQLCLYSKILYKIGYSELGDIVKQFGFDGVDLTVRPGGHVEPRLSSVDLVRAFESILAVGLVCPMITTAVTSPLEPGALAVIALSGRTNVSLFCVGFWKDSLPTYRRDLAGLISIGQRYNIAMALHNYTSENEGETDWSVAATLRQLDPKWAGAYFDPIHHGSGWEEALTPLLPNLRVIALKDFRKDGTPCPLGEGTVNWAKFFAVLQAASFGGVLSLRIEYSPKDELSAIQKDYAFARAHMGTFPGSGSGAGSGSGMG